MGETITTPLMPYDERDEDTGRFTPEFADADFLDAVGDRELPTTSDIADAVGCKYRTAYERLNRLEDEGAVASKKVGNSLVWMLTGDGND
jgi:hypothetical protein